MKANKIPVVTMTPDYDVENHGSIVLVRPSNELAQAHLRERTDGMWFGNALCVEPRYVDDLLFNLQADGFRIAEGA